MNLPQEVQIDVTQDDINQGIKKSACSCAIARAVARVFPDYMVKVSHQTISLYQGNPWIPIKNYVFREHVIDFIVNFDDGIDVDPMTFTMGTWNVEDDD